MRPFIVCLWTLIAPIVLAQELHTFSNGEVADADKINENFQYLLENATGSSGCSAQQDGSSVLITCADGTSGVLASQGTVVTYPVGSSDVLDISTLPTGAIVVADANDVVLAGYVEGSYGNYLVNLGVGVTILATIFNDDNAQTVNVGVYSQEPIYFNEVDCKGQGFVGNTSYLSLGPDDEYFTVASESVQIPQVTQSKFTGTECINIETASNGFWTVFPYSLAPELTNAVYPAKLYQVP
jgi:hypothetical protein